jgi:hypothetical protein
MSTFRVTEELHHLITRTALHVGLDASTVIRKTARGIRRGRPVVHFHCAESYYKNPVKVIRVRDFTMPPGIEPEQFRKLLAMRCMEELQKQKITLPTFREVEGVDYIVEDTE